ncbi:MAG: protein kinase [Muribaculaceae bacterium]
MYTSALAVGTVLHSPNHSYTIRRVLGQGGFGITYLVDTQLRMGNIDFRQSFALKEHFVDIYCYRQDNSQCIGYHPSKAREVELSKRAFISESQRLQKLGIKHPNIVKVDEVFEANGTAYYVMEYLRGNSLSEHVHSAAGGRLDFDHTAALMRPICEAVAMLHANRVAHYDIKPQNIMIEQDSYGNIRPVLIDFGLAKHYDGQGQATSSIVSGGYTPGYAPNEQYQGLSSFAPTADVYALAATICFCLTGHTPAKAAELNLDTLSEDLLLKGVDDSIVNVLCRAMEFRPVDRPADAGVLTDALFGGSMSAGAARPEAHEETELQVPPVVDARPESDAPKPPTPRESLSHKPQNTPRPIVAPPSSEPSATTTSKSSWGKRVAFITIVLAIIVIIAFPVVFKVLAIFVLLFAVISLRKLLFKQRDAGEDNLKLQVTDRQGYKHLLTGKEWQLLSTIEQSKYTKVGLVIDYNGVRFIAALNMERNGNSSTPRIFTWDDAMQNVGISSSGWRLPTKDEGKAMADQYQEVCAAITAFGGDDNPASWYWTSTESDVSRAYFFSLIKSSIYNFGKEHYNYVRAVRDVY